VKPAVTPGWTPPACLHAQEAQEIFGDVSGLLADYAARRRAHGGAPEPADVEEGLAEEDFDDEEAAEQYRAEREERVRARAEARARAQV